MHRDIWIGLTNEFAKVYFTDIFKKIRGNDCRVKISQWY